MYLLLAGLATKRPASVRLSRAPSRSRRGRSFRDRTGASDASAAAADQWLICQSRAGRKSAAPPDGTQLSARAEKRPTCGRLFGWREHAHTQVSARVCSQEAPSGAAVTATATATARQVRRSCGGTVRCCRLMVRGSCRPSRVVLAAARKEARAITTSAIRGRGADSSDKRQCQKKCSKMLIYS